MTVNIALVIALVASVGINIFGFWYVRDILGRLTWISQNINDVARVIEIHMGHLKAVHRLEQFYGDQELTGLIEHTQATIEILEEYQTAVLTLEPTEEGMEETSNQKDNNDHDEEETEEGIQKDVLYAGTRRRDS